MNKTQKNRQKRGIDLVSNLIKRNRPLLITLSAAVVFVTTYLLILPAVTLDTQQAQKQGGIDLPAAQEQQAEPAAADDAAVDDADAADAAEAEEPAEPAAVKKSATGEEPEEGDDLPAQSAAREQHGDFYALSYDGGDYNVALAYPESAEIPADAGLEVREIPQGSGEYNQYLKKSAKKLGVAKDDVAFARFFDIQITRDGEKIEPSDDVVINVTYEDPLQTEEADDLSVVHFGEDGTEVIDAVSVDESRQEIAWQQDSFSVTGTIVTTPNTGNQYMVLVKYDGKYYIVNNDGSLEYAPLDEKDSGKVKVDDPMMWTYTGDNLYHNSIQVDFGSNQCASDYYYRYINPADDDTETEKENSDIQEDHMPGISADNAGNTERQTNTERVFDWMTWQWKNFYYETVKTTSGARHEMANAALTYDGEHLKSKNADKYIGLVIENGVPVRITGNKDAGEAAEIVMAKTGEILQTQHYLNNTVNHIDISIVGTAGIDIPLAYGNYYNEKGEVIKTVTDAETLTLTEDHVGIKTDDMKKARIEAFTKNPATGQKVPLDDAFIVTGYSANAETDYSTDQVRIEGVFKVSTDHEPGRTEGYSQSYYNQKKSSIWTDRKKDENRVYYTVTAVKPITFDLVDPKVGQLYDANGDKLTITVDVAFSASFDYWDSGNECPPLQGNSDWKKGDIPDHNLSGMDFVLGGNPDDINSQTLAIEITKMIVDENENRIRPKDQITNTFDLYYNTRDNSAGAADKVKTPGEESWDKNDYSVVHQKNITVGQDGLGLVYDYDVSGGMYYIQEDPNSIPEELKDASGQDWYYKETFIRTEYAWRNCEYDSQKWHTSDSYTYKVNEDGSLTQYRIDENGVLTETGADFSSIPEVLGNYKGYSDGKTYRNGFLEFFVYNVYESPKVNVPVVKNWPAFASDDYDWEAKFQLQWAPTDKDGNVTDNFRDVSPEKKLTITREMMQGITKEDVQRYLENIQDPAYVLTDKDQKIEALTFKDLPKYTTDASGRTVRIQYSLEELSYKVTNKSDGRTWRERTWSKSEGYKTDGAKDNDAENHFQAFYPHDAGEDEESDTDYYVDVTNAVKNISQQEKVTINLTKKWDESIKGSGSEDRWAEFELKRYVHTEYRDLSHLSAEDILADPITVQLKDTSGNVLDSIQAQPNTGLYLAGNFKARSQDQNITFEYEDVTKAAGEQTQTVTVKAEGSNASKQLVRSSQICISEAMLGEGNTDRVFVITLKDGADSLVAGANGARILDTSGGTDPLPDTSFTSETVRLDKDNSWTASWNDLLQSETTQGDEDDNENVTIYEYYLVERGSSPEGFAEFFLAGGENNQAATEVRLGDVNNRIEDGGEDKAAYVVAVNNEANRLKVEKIWRGVPDTTGYPEIKFTLYQGWANADGTVSINGGDSWVYENDQHVKYEDITLGDGAWTWVCPENLPTTKLDPKQNNAQRDVGYYVKESQDRGSLGSTSWQFYYYANDKGKQTNAFNQAGGAGISGDQLKNGGTITICNQLGKYLQMDVKKQFFMQGDDGSWANVTATTDVSANTVLGFKVIRSIQLPDGTFLDEQGNVSDQRVWMDYGDELLVGYDENGNAITKNGGINDFYLESGGGDWHFRIRDEPGGANNRAVDKVGLPANGYYIRDGKSVAVSYAYSFRETGVYRDLNRTPYENWQWFSSVTPDRYVDGNGQHSGEFGTIFAGQDGERVANFQASDLQITKTWTGENTDVQEVYVKIYRIPDGGEKEDFTQIIADDIVNHSNWQNYLSDVHDIDTENQWLILKNKGHGEWTVTDILVNRALLGSVDNRTEDFRAYTYYIEEVGYKDADGTVHTDGVQKFRPVYSKWRDGRWITSGSDPESNTIRLGSVGENKMEVTNKNGASTSYTVHKKFAKAGQALVYPTDGSAQAVVSLQQRYRYEKEENGDLYVLKKGGDYDTDSDWIKVTDENDEAVQAAWLVDWQAAESANPVSVTLPLPKPISWTGTDEEWYGSDAAWTYTWTGLDVSKKLDASDHEATLYYRSVETGTPGWFNALTDSSDGHRAVDDEKQSETEAASEKTELTNQRADDSLTIDKKWTGYDGEEINWPSGYTVDYRIIQNYHLVKADLTGSTPKYLPLGPAFRSVPMITDSGEPSEALGPDVKHPQATGTLSNSDPVTINDLPAFGYYIPTTDEEIEDAAKAGVTLKKGTTYLVVYTYSVKETGVKAEDTPVDYAAQTVEAEPVSGDNTSYTATLSNQLTTLKVTKQWTKNGNEAEWPEGAKILYRVDRQATYKGKVVDKTEGIFTATETKGALTAEHPSYEIDQLPVAGTWTCASQQDADEDRGIAVNGSYPVTYTYTVTELVESVPPTGSSYVYAESTEKAEEIAEGSDQGKLGAVLTNDYTELSVNKIWKKDGSATDWPEGYTVSYQVWQDVYLVRNGKKGAKPFRSAAYGEPGSLSRANEVDTISLLPVNGIYKATAEDVSSGLEEGTTYTVAYGYSVRETVVSASGADKPVYEPDTETVYQPEEGSVNGTKYSNLATITNELTELKVRKAWTKNGQAYEENDGWLGNAKVYFTVDKVTLYNGREVASERVYPAAADGESEALESANAEVTVSNLAKLPESGSWTAEIPSGETDAQEAARTTLWTKAGVEEGHKYTVTYQYVVKEDTKKSTITEIGGKAVANNGGFFSYPMKGEFKEDLGAYVITNDFTQIDVEKRFKGNTGTEATVQLYSSTVAPDGSTSPETFNITVQVPTDRWTYTDGDQAAAPTTYDGGTITVKIMKGEEEVETLVLSPDHWKAVSNDLPKDGSQYSVVVTGTDGDVVDRATIDGTASGITDDAIVNLNALRKIGYINVNVKVENAPDGFSLNGVLKQETGTSQDTHIYNGASIEYTLKLPSHKKPLKFEFSGGNKDRYTVTTTTGTVSNQDVTGITESGEIVLTYHEPLSITVRVPSNNDWTPGDSSNDGTITVEVIDKSDNNSFVEELQLKKNSWSATTSTTLEPTHQYSVRIKSKTDEIQSAEVVASTNTGLTGYGNKTVDVTAKAKKTSVGDEVTIPLSVTHWSEGVTNNQRIDLQEVRRAEFKDGVWRNEKYINNPNNPSDMQDYQPINNSTKKLFSNNSEKQELVFSDKDGTDPGNRKNDVHIYENGAYTDKIVYYWAKLGMDSVKLPIYIKGNGIKVIGGNQSDIVNGENLVTITKWSGDYKLIFPADVGSITFSCTKTFEETGNNASVSPLSVSSLSSIQTLNGTEQSGGMKMLSKLKKAASGLGLLGAGNDQDYLEIDPSTVSENNNFIDDIVRPDNSEDGQIIRSGQTPPTDIAAVEGTEVTLNGEADQAGEYESWKAKWEYLPTVNADGNHIYYYVVETGAKATGATGMTADYKVTESGYIKDGNKIVQINHVDIVNTPGQPDKITVAAKKQWKQADDSTDGVDPKHFQVEFALYSDEACTREAAERKTITGNGTASWPNLDSATYYVKETKVSYLDETGTETVLWSADDGQSSANPWFESASADTIYNKLPTTEISAGKQWENANGTNAAPAGAKVTFTLMADGEPTSHTVELNGTADGDGSSAWTANFTDLPKYNNEGVEIHYTVKETGTWTNYTPDKSEVETGGTITNTPDRGKLKVTKEVFFDGKSPDQLADDPQKDKKYYVTISTVIDGTTYYVTDKVGKLAQSAPEGDKCLYVTADQPLEIDGLPAGTYTVEEDTENASIPGYTFDVANSTSSQTAAVEKGQQAEAELINSYTQDKTSFKVVKEWEDYDPGTEEITTSVTFSLHRAINGVEDPNFEADTITLPQDADSGDAPWEKTWTNLQKYGKFKYTPEGGEEKTLEGDFTYYVTEEAVTDSKDKSITKDEFEVNNEGVKRKLNAEPDDGVDTQTVTNRKNTISLTVTKDWTELPEVQKYSYSITFKVQRYNEESRMWEDYDGSDDDEITGTYTMSYSSESGEFTDNVVSGLPAGRKYRAVETAYSISLNNGQAVEKTITMNGSSEAASDGWKSRITNKWEPVTIDLSGSKTWIDGQTSHEDPQLTLMRSINGEEGRAVMTNKLSPTVYDDGLNKSIDDASEDDIVKLQPVWSTESGKRVYHYYDLPKYDDQYNEYRYTVTEDAQEGYATETNTSNDGYETDFINTEVAGLKVTKRWFPGARDSEKQSVEFILQKKIGEGDWEKVQTYQLPKNGNEWEEQISDLPLYEAVEKEDEETGDTLTVNEPVTYRVYETKLNGTELVYGSNDVSSLRHDGDWLITNPGEVALTAGKTTSAVINNDKEQTSLSGKKTWVTSMREKASGDRQLPDLTLKLERRLIWEEPDGQDGTVTRESEWEDISGQVKSTDDPYEDYHFEWGKPDSIADNQTLTWSYAFTHLPKYLTDGGIVKTAYYRVREEMSGDNSDKFISGNQYSEGEIDPATGYIKNADFTNTEKTQVSVSKIWKLNDEEITDPYGFDGTESVTLYLYRIGDTYNSVNHFKYKVGESEEQIETTDGSITLQRIKNTATGQYEWPKITVVDLEKYGTSGTALVEYKYYFTEEETNGWKPQYFNTAADPNGKWQESAVSAAVPGGGEFKIQNSKYAVELPSTGGPGTTWIYLLGTILLLGCGVALTSRRRARTRHQ